MIEWLKSLPKVMFVTLVLGAGVLFIVISDPPRNLCDSQIDVLNADTNRFLGSDPQKPSQATSNYVRLRDICKSTNTPGGCYEFFSELKKMVKEMRAVSPECQKKITSSGAVIGAVWESLDLLARIAWGNEPPLTAAVRAGWLDAADLNLFCELKTQVLRIHSEERWNSFVEGYFKSLPGADKLPRSDVWQRMLFSTNCASYL